MALTVLHQDRDMPTEPSQESDAVFRVCMVCTGNICRSPMAEIVLRELINEAGLSAVVSVTSAGTGDWHVGEQADPRTIDALSRRGYDGRQHRAKQFETRSFDRYDLIVVLDRTHERVVRSWARTDSDKSKIRLLTSFDPVLSQRADVADPYYSDEAMFDSVLSTIEQACKSLFRQLEPAFRPPATDSMPIVGSAPQIPTP